MRAICSESITKIEGSRTSLVSTWLRREALHPALGGGEVRETELAVKLMCVRGGQYPSAQALQLRVRDLERQSNLTPTQAGCVVTAIRRHFETEIAQTQKANHGSRLLPDRLKLEVDGALAALRAPSGSENLAARTAIAKCAPAALR